MIIAFDQVLVHLEKTEIPPGNIMTRWTKDAIEDLVQSKEAQRGACIEDTANYLRKQLWLKKLLSCAGVAGPVSETGLGDAMSSLDELISEIKTGTDAKANIECQETVSGAAGPSQCPARPARKGRPRNTSLKSYKEEQKRCKKGGNGSTKSMAATTDEENQSHAKTKTIAELIIAS